MSEAEAGKLAITPERRRFYFKVENAKFNLGPPAEFADWYESKGQEIDNGETIGVCVPVTLIPRDQVEEVGETALKREAVLTYLRDKVPKDGINLDAIKDGLRNAGGIKATRTREVFKAGRQLLGDENEFVFSQPGGERKPYWVERVGAKSGPTPN